VIDLSSKKTFRAFVLFNLAFCVAVIVFGAFVRASGSGAGCGSHWPLCNGVLVQAGTVKQKTWIEMSHRMSSGLLLLFIGAQLAWARKLFTRGSFTRNAALLSFVAVIIEALIGAFIVLLGYVEHDKSIDRVLSMSLHLANTLFLVGALTCTLFSAAHHQPRWRWPVREERWWPLGLIFGFGFLGGLGAVAARGDTLFPPSSVLAGILSDLNGRSHVAERIRILHPLLAVSWVGAAAWWISGLWEKAPSLKPHGKLVLWAACLNMGLGLLNVLTLAPVGLQLVHLMVAEVLWILFVSFLFSAASNMRWQ
jgi:cytochrome c oxidase assembly protein subunit 15